MSQPKEALQTLDYGQHRPKLSRRTVNVIILVLAVGALSVVGWKVPEWYRQRQAARLANAYRLIDAEIPGTEVYFKDKLLGKTPLTLSKADCAAIGLPVADGVRVDWDGWGEGVSLHDPTTNSDPRVMYKVPGSSADSYLNYETPWGLRTKMGGGWELPNGFRTKFMPRGQDGIGVIVTIDFSSKPNRSDQILPVKVTVTHTGTAVYSGFRPTIELHWGTFDVQWARRFHKKFPLPNEWANISPGQQLQTTVEIPLPAKSGDYSVFGTLNVFQDETSDYLAGRGSVYSDSKLLHVP